MLLINEIKCPLDYDEKLVISKICHKLKVPFKAISNYQIIKRSVDARKDIRYILQVLVKIQDEDKYLYIDGVSRHEEADLKVKEIKSTTRPIVIGYGPSGIFMTYRLAEAGLRPIVIEKGSRIDKRKEDVEKFFKTGILNANSNVQFGEGGAGTFSDAKLTTRIKSPYIPYILDILVKHGANPDIKIDAHPHIGTDKIRKVIKNITDHLISLGVEFHFDESFVDLLTEDDRVIGIKTDRDVYYSDIIITAAGHSAFDLIKNLHVHHVHIKNKDFAIGFRVEHPQDLIDANQYKDISLVDHLGHAEYFLRYKGNRGVYSFCMCPGGIVVASSSEKNTIVTNGMSYSKRNSGMANSAILIQVNVEDYDKNDILSGFDLIHHYEQKAYNLSNSYRALAMNIKDYINDELNPLIFKSTYPLGTFLYDINKFFPNTYNEEFKKAIRFFDNKIPGFIASGIMLGPETRSSSPVRIVRDENGESINTKGLYPIGEGSGYGGGIMSCALDGIKIADKILNKLS